MLHKAISNAQSDCIFLMRSVWARVSNKIVWLMSLNGVINNDAIKYSQWFLDGLKHAQTIIDKINNL